MSTDTGSLVVKVSEDFVRACKNDDFDAIRGLLRDGATITYEDKHGWGGLHWASCNGNLELVKLLLKNGAAGPYQTSMVER